MTNHEYISAILADRDRCKPVVANEHHLNQYKQVLHVNSKGNTMLTIVPDTCPTGRYCCQSVMVQGNRREYDKFCLNMLSSDDNSITCDIMAIK